MATYLLRLGFNCPLMFEAAQSRLLEAKRLRLDIFKSDSDSMVITAMTGSLDRERKECFGLLKACYFHLLPLADVDDSFFLANLSLDNYRSGVDGIIVRGYMGNTPIEIDLDNICLFAGISPSHYRNAVNHVPITDSSDLRNFLPEPALLHELLLSQADKLIHNADELKALF